ncbi:MAG: GFA family protein [Pseudomonadota bacterium]
MSDSGQCLCGAVTFEAEGVERHFHSCHCGACRRWSGSPAMAARVSSVLFNDDAPVRTFASSEWAERGFCGECGSNLFYRMRDTGDTMMWIGTFNDQGAFHMSGEIYVDAKPDSYAFAGDHPRMTEAEFLASIGMADS